MYFAAGHLRRFGLLDYLTLWFFTILLEKTLITHRLISATRSYSEEQELNPNVVGGFA